MKDASMTSQQIFFHVYPQEIRYMSHKCGTKQLSFHKNPYVKRQSGENDMRKFYFFLVLIIFQH